MLDVHLTPQMQEFAEREVAAGRYADVSDVVQAAVRKLMEERGEAAVPKIDQSDRVHQRVARLAKPFEPGVFW